jgi:hypothetical protein
MDTIIFRGRVITPKDTPLTFTTDFRADAIYEAGTPLDGLEAQFEFSIINSLVEIRCHVNRISDTDYEALLLSAFELTRSSVDLMAFSTGHGMTLILDKAFYPDGRELDIYHDDPSLPPLCTAYRINESNGNINDVLLIVTLDRQVMLALNDLTSTMEVPMRIPANCFRAIEAIKQAISRAGRPPKRYSLLRDALNVDDTYINPVEEESKGPRHGDYHRPPVVPLSDAEIRQRAWRVMNRFLEFRKRGNLPLTSPEFDLLE